MQFIEGYERKVLQVNWSKTTCVTLYYYTKEVKFIAETSDCKKTYFQMLIYVNIFLIQSW